MRDDDELTTDHDVGELDAHALVQGTIAPLPAPARLAALRHGGPFLGASQPPVQREVRPRVEPRTAELAQAGCRPLRYEVPTTSEPNLATAQ